MPFDAESLARVHAQAFNTHDLESCLYQYASSAKIVRDGKLVGEGRGEVKKGIEEEYHDGGYVQVKHIDGEPVLAECHGPQDDPEFEGVIRFHNVGEFLDEVRIDHDPRVLARMN